MATKRLCDICGKECTMDENVSLYFGPMTPMPRSMTTDIEIKTIILNDICRDCYNWLMKEVKCRRELYENVE